MQEYQQLLTNVLILTYANVHSLLYLWRDFIKLSSVKILFAFFLQTDHNNQQTEKMRGEALTGFNPPSTVLSFSVALCLTD